MYTLGPDSVATAITQVAVMARSTPGSSLLDRGNSHNHSHSQSHSQSHSHSHSHSSAADGSVEDGQHLISEFDDEDCDSRDPRNSKVGKESGTRGVGQGKRALKPQVFRMQPTSGSISRTTSSVTIMNESVNMLRSLSVGSVDSGSGMGDVALPTGDSYDGKVILPQVCDQSVIVGRYFSGSSSSYGWLMFSIIIVL